MNRKFKTIVSLALALCMLSGFMAASADAGIAPCMTNLESGQVSIYSEDGYVTVSVITTSIEPVEKLYHTITVSRNGEVLMNAKTYSKKNTAYICTEIDFDAEDGDIFKVVVDHSAKDGSVVETKRTTTYGDY